MRPSDPSKALRFFEHRSSQEIREGGFLQFDDSDLLMVAEQFQDEDDQERYIATLDAILHSIDHDYLFIDYDELYEEVIAANIGLRGRKDDIALAIARIAYNCRHGFPENIYLAWNKLIYEFLGRGETAKEVEIGLHLLERYLKFLPHDALSAESLITILFWRRETFDIGVNLTQKIIDAAYEAEDEDQFLFWADSLSGAEAELDEAEGEDEIEPMMVEEGILDSLVEVILTLPITSPGEEVDEDFVVAELPRLGALTGEGVTEDEWKRTLEDQAQWLLPELIFFALWPKDVEETVAQKAVASLQYIWERRLAPLDELDAWLQRAHGDWRIYLTQELCKVGFLFPDELMAVAENISTNMSLRIGAIEVLLRITQRKPEIKPEVETFFRRLLTRPESRSVYAEEEIIASLIAEVLDYPEWKTLIPEIEVAFQDDVVDPEVVSVEDVESAWGVVLDVQRRFPDISKGEYLPLRCKKCGSTRFHHVESVLVDMNSLEKWGGEEVARYSPFIMDKEIVCPRCGARDNYELTQFLNLRLLSLVFPDLPLPADDPLSVMFDSLLRKIPMNLEVMVMRPTDVAGTDIHPLELRDRYQALIEKNPREIENYIRLSNVYKNIGRGEEALNVLRRASKIEPDDLEVLLMLAMAEHDNGDPDQARRLYSKVIEEVARVSGFIPRRDELETVNIARNGLSNLEKGKPSPWRQGARDARTQASGRSQQRKGRRRKKKKGRKKKRR